jgi:hypothetical protein
MRNNPCNRVLDESLLTSAVAKAAMEKVIGGKGTFVIVWDEFGYVRAYSTEQNNFHFGVGELFGLMQNHSHVVNI